MDNLKCGKEIVEQLKVGSFCRVHAAPQHNAGVNDVDEMLCTSIKPRTEIVGRVGRVFHICEIEGESTYFDVFIDDFAYDSVDACYLTPVKGLLD